MKFFPSVQEYVIDIHLRILNRPTGAVMEEFGIPPKLIKLTKATQTDGRRSDGQIDTGERQGDRLSSLLFNLALEKVVRTMSINWKRTIFNTFKQKIYMR